MCLLICLIILLFCSFISFFCFFFKQKTAYEMRISDWSSDVCSSDLGDRDRVWPDTDREVGGKRNAPARRGRSARRLKSWLNGFFCLAGARGRASRSLHGGGRKTDVPPANKNARIARASFN